MTTWGFYKVGNVLSRMLIHTYYYDVLHVKVPFVIPLCQGFMLKLCVALLALSVLFVLALSCLCWSFAHFVTPCNVHSTLCDITSHKHTTCVHCWHQAIFCCWFVFLFLNYVLFCVFYFQAFHFQAVIFKLMFSSFSFSLSSCSYFVVFSFSISYFHNIWK
jgi:hypothetical protein